MSAQVAKKGLFSKTNAQGQSVMRDRTKAGLAAGGGLLLFTDVGGNIASSAVGQASENVGKVGGSFIDGLKPLFVPVSLSSCVVLCFGFAFVVLTKM